MTDLSGRALVFSAEFDDPAAPLVRAEGGPFDPWYWYWAGPDAQTRSLAGNDEAQTYIDPSLADPGDPARPWSVADGVLTIRAQPTPAALSDDVSSPYVSGLLETAGGKRGEPTHEPFTQKFGYWEARVEVPQGKGLWPAFWLIGRDANGNDVEIDILETLGHEVGPGGSVAHHAVHNFTKGGTFHRSASVPLPDDLSAGFHTFGFEWTADALVWSVDGVETWRQPGADFASWPDMALVVNLAVGGSRSWPGAPDASTAFPAEYRIDCIRAYGPRGVPAADGDFVLGTKAGSDLLVGTAGADTLSGLDNADTLRGGAGNDQYYGGWGRDTFVHASGDGFDVVKDWTPRHGDTVRFEGIARTETRVEAGYRDPATGLGGTVIHTPGGGVLLQDFAGTLGRTDLVFV